MKMIIENEWQYRYIIDFLERERDMLNELRSSHMSCVSSCLPELSSAIIPARIDKVRNKIIFGFKDSGRKFPFEVDV